MVLGDEGIPPFALLRTGVGAVTRLVSGVTRERPWWAWNGVCDVRLTGADTRPDMRQLLDKS